VPSLQQGKSIKPEEIIPHPHRHPCEAIQPRPCGFSRPSSTFSYWSLLLVHNDRQAYQMDRGGPDPQHGGFHLRRCFIAGWVSRFGVPATVTSDRGRQFTSAIWEVLCRRLGIHHVTTAAYHPQSNGMIERAHRQIKDALRSRAASDNWTTHLPWILLGLRAAPKDDSNTSSAELVFGCRITVPGQFLDSPELPATSFLEELQDVQPIPTRQRFYAEVAAALPPGLLAAKFVYIQKGGSVPPLSPPYEGPFSVVEAGSKFFTVDISGRRETVSVDRLKPHTGSSTPTPAVPPRRGRPLGTKRSVSAAPPAATGLDLGGSPVATPTG
jgi:hypothetical protein